ncbi:DNA starvation/stationary phase protection protein [Mycobacterium yunnanensis]|uniref:DNA starvation/stationary phase protection protein n=1 Tax=Mycobacterium yunnanensis TaxID=368477 RepID=A0A9X2YHH4_9MYCO|nr:DNA starvation/stationary phase protection protein [Mycobacterium yunnanensis]MCV7419352.1 DNA starvation/stationary phase protection protein [Mycobacterium yunnanensis]
MTTTTHDVLAGEFVASPALAAHLQTVLVGLLELQSQAKQAHWTVVGPNFRSIHLELDEIVDAARDYADSVAERMRALEAVPDGRTATVATTTTLDAFPAGEVVVERVVALIADRILAVVNAIRAVHDEVDDQDPTSADILHTILEGLEKQRWMLAAQLRHGS